VTPADGLIAVVSVDTVLLRVQVFGDVVDPSYVESSRNGRSGRGFVPRADALLPIESNASSPCHDIE